jgi:endoglucanase
MKSMLHNYCRCVLLLIIVFSSLGARTQDTAKKNYHAWWNEGYPAQPGKNNKAKLLPLIHVYKNRFVNAKGDSLLFRGLSISDPDKIEHQGHWNKNHFEKIRELGTY